MPATGITSQKLKQKMQKPDERLVERAVLRVMRRQAMSICKRPMKDGPDARKKKGPARLTNNSSETKKNGKTKDVERRGERVELRVRSVELERSKSSKRLRWLELKRKQRNGVNDDG